MQYARGNTCTDLMHGWGSLTPPLKAKVYPICVSPLSHSCLWGKGLGEGGLQTGGEKSIKPWKGFHSLCLWNGLKIPTPLPGHIIFNIITSVSSLCSVGVFLRH